MPLSRQFSIVSPELPKAESFMKTLKQEKVDGSAYRDADDARTRIGDFIDEV